MNPLLSNTFPEMDDEEFAQWIRHRGMFTVAYYDYQIKEHVAAKYCSIAFFLDKAGIEDTPENRDKVAAQLGWHGKYSVAGNGGRGVTIYQYTVAGG